MFKHILVTLDGSLFSERALTYAVDVARPSQARVTLLTVITSEALPLDDEVPVPGDARLESWRAYHDKHLSRLREAGVQHIATELRSGSPVRTITMIARELGVDLIVMSTQGVGAAVENGLGSVAAGVLASVSCPVLMIRVARPARPRTPDEERWQSEGGANVG
jgi:nucleotide-binding universal stress UspA family protein